MELSHANVRRLQSQRDAFKEQVTRLDSDLDTARRVARSANYEVDRLQDQLAEADVRIAELQGAAERLPAIEAQVAELVEQLAQERAERAAVEAERARLEQRVDEMSGQSFQDFAEVLAARNDRHALAGRLEEVTRELAVERSTSSGLRADIEVAQAELAQLREQLEQADVKKLRRRLAEAHEENRRQGRQLQELGALIARGGAPSVAEQARALRQLRQRGAAQSQNLTESTPSEQAQTA